MSAPDGDQPLSEDENPDLHLPAEEVEAEEVTAAENTEIQRIVELLPPEKRAQLFGYIRQETMSHSGWLPTPSFMREYEQVLPGLAERIVAMPEREQGFRHSATQDLIQRDYGLRKTGQWLGILALVLILAFCAFLAAIGGIAAAASVAGVTIVSTVGIFVLGQVAGKSSATSKDLVESDSSSAE